MCCIQDCKKLRVRLYCSPFFYQGCHFCSLGVCNSCDMCFVDAQLSALSIKFCPCIQQIAAERHCFCLLDFHDASADQQASEETSKVPGTRSKSRFVEVVHVEVDEPVVAL